ncbi:MULTISPECIES: hypothetical protein [Streptomyces]|uniref:hypothetical protein n=1 Tax=Streptomyces TaxID=1883 RepID=UPI001E5C9234|nr:MULTISPECIES: hypothetical protein [Streptomyces]UFQ16443.1 hypothetical protein J2N69_16320 [Streptomyces huasconensis]WCL86045.1 hypothetical protein PPN52_16330 [Streptomyces sp. JCM 35825]
MPEITYQAAWTPEDQEVTVIQNIRAGISGPFGDWPAATRDEAVRVLAEQGYHLAGPWTETRSGDHWVDLVYIGR